MRRVEQPSGWRRRLSYRLALRAAVASGAKAYGFTLVIWTTAALVVSQHGIPRAGEAFASLLLRPDPDDAQDR